MQGAEEGRCEALSGGEPFGGGVRVSLDKALASRCWLLLFLGGSLREKLRKLKAGTAASLLLPLWLRPFQLSLGREHQSQPSAGSDFRVPSQGGPRAPSTLSLSPVTPGRLQISGPILTETEDH